VEVSLPVDSIEAPLAPGYERKPLERDEHAWTGAFLERIGRHDATQRVATRTHRVDSVPTAMDEF
jgi:hypothetical protein